MTATDYLADNSQRWSQPAAVDVAPVDVSELYSGANASVSVPVGRKALTVAIKEFLPQTLPCMPMTRA